MGKLISVTVRYFQGQSIYGIDRDKTAEAVQ